MATEWICKDCGQENDNGDDNCFVCDSTRQASELKEGEKIEKTNNATFEIDGQKVEYVNPAEKEPGDGKVYEDWKEISRIKKEQGL